MTWTIAEARDQFSEVVRRAVDQGPQRISVRGKDTVVILSVAQYDALTPQTPKKTFKDHLLAFPKVEELDVERWQTPPREFEF